MISSLTGGRDMGKRTDAILFWLWGRLHVEELLHPERTTSSPERVHEIPAPEVSDAWKRT
jgi:hypothetical protein